MTYSHAIILGLVQGLTEFLPVSSSGHLALGHLWFGDVGKSDRAFDIVVHGATLIVILFAFGRVFWSMVRSKPIWLGIVFLALIPSAAVGFFARDLMGALGQSPWALGVCFGITGLFLWALQIFVPTEDEKDEPAVVDLQEIGLFRALLVGLSQAIALAPGVSRSGITISVGRLSGISSEQAVAFSFVLGAPAILGALIVEAHPIGDLVVSNPGPLVAGFMAALLSGVAAVGLLKWISRKGSLPKFAPYCFMLFGICLLLGAVGK